MFNISYIYITFMENSLTSRFFYSIQVKKHLNSAFAVIQRFFKAVKKTFLWCMCA